MSETKIKSLEKNIKKAQADKAKAPDFKKLSFAKKIKEYKKELAALRNKNKSPNKPGSGLGIKQDSKKNRIGGQTIEKRKKDKVDKETTKTGISSLSGVGRDKLRTKLRTNKQSGDSRTNRPSGRTDSKTVGKEQKERQAKLPPREGMGGKATVSPEQKSRQATLPKDSREEGIGVRIARMLGDKRSVSQMIRDREESEAMEEEMNFRKGGAVSKKYGMRAGGFTKRGGLYKKGY